MEISVGATNSTANIPAGGVGEAADDVVPEPESGGEIDIISSWKCFDID